MRKVTALALPATPRGVEAAERHVRYVVRVGALVAVHAVAPVQEVGAHATPLLRWHAVRTLNEESHSWSVVVEAPS